MEETERERLSLKKQFINLFYATNAKQLKTDPALNQIYATKERDFTILSKSKRLS